MQVGARIVPGTWDVFISSSLAHWLGLERLMKSLKAADLTYTFSEDWLGTTEKFPCKCGLFASSMVARRELRLASLVHVPIGFLSDTDSQTEAVSEVAASLPNAVFFSSHEEELMSRLVDFVRICSQPAVVLTLAKDRRVVVDSTSRLKQIVVAAAAHPQILQQIQSREFEHLVAYLLEQDGYDVELTKQTRDGGYDIAAWQNPGGFAPSLCLVECKLWSIDNPVDVTVVRSLQAVRDSHRFATSGALVTTSRFTSDAVDWANTKTKLIHLRNHAYLVDWIKRLSAGRGL